MRPVPPSVPQRSADTSVLGLPRPAGDAPDFHAATQALDAALASLPLGALNGAHGELKREYASLVLYVLHTKERLEQLGRSWDDAAAKPPAAA